MMTHLHGQCICKEQEMSSTATNASASNDIEGTNGVNEALTSLLSWRKVWGHGRSQPESGGQSVELQ